jgi:hypothetical protein
LRKIGLAESAAKFTFHGVNDFGLRHGAAKTAERTLDGAKGADFIAESHEEGLS